jgi:hypothetical protein
MPKTENVNVNVVELTKWGFKDQMGYVSLSKNLTEKDKAVLVPGVAFSAELYIADSGTRYLNRILSKVETPITATKAVTDVNPPKDVERAKKFTPKYSKPEAGTSAGLTKDEWASKDRRISRQGCIQVAVQVAGSFEDAAILADKMLEYVNRV